MIVSCPHCSTNFKVPEAALGRMVKCARCGHVWKATASSAKEPPTPPARPAARAAPPPVATPAPTPAPAPYNSFDDEIPLESPPTPSRRTQPDPVFEDFPTDDPALSEIDKLGFTGEGGDPFKEDDEDDPFGKMSELMSARQPESMPDMFSPPRPKRPLPRRKGSAILWVLVLILVLAASALGLYFFQDRVLDRWPDAGKYYDKVGLRRDVVGDGLAFRNILPERLMQENAEVMVVKGVIANTSDKRRDIPSMRLVFYADSALKEPLQEKIFAPPQPYLDPRAAVGFKLVVDQPDPNAKNFEVTFIATKAAEK